MEPFRVLVFLEDPLASNHLQLFLYLFQEYPVLFLVPSLHYLVLFLLSLHFYLLYLTTWRLKLTQHAVSNADSSNSGRHNHAHYVN